MAKKDVQNRNILRFLAGHMSEGDEAELSTEELESLRQVLESNEDQITTSKELQSLKIAMGKAAMKLGTAEKSIATLTKAHDGTKGTMTSSVDKIADTVRKMAKSVDTMAKSVDAQPKALDAPMAEMSRKLDQVSIALATLIKLEEKRSAPKRYIIRRDRDGDMAEVEVERCPLH